MPCNEGERRSSRTLARFTRKLGRWDGPDPTSTHEETKRGRDSEQTVLVAALREEDSSAAVAAGEALVANAIVGSEADRTTKALAGTGAVSARSVGAAQDHRHARC